MLPMPIVVAFDGPVQPREEVGHAQQAERADQRERGADQHQPGHDPLQQRRELPSSASYSMTSPRVRNFDSTTVVMKPSIAISSAAS